MAETKIKKETKSLSVKKVQNKSNVMKKVILEKVTVNICVGNDKKGMIKAEKLLRMLTNKTPVKNVARKRLAAWQIRPGLPIGYKVTIRSKDAKDFLQRVLDSKGKKFKASSIDMNGNFSIGFHEYLDLSGMKYDADIGIMGFEVMVSFTRPGFRIKTRKYLKTKVPARHRVQKEEVIEFMKANLGVSVI